MRVVLFATVLPFLVLAACGQPIKSGPEEEVYFAAVRELSDNATTQQDSFFTWIRANEGRSVSTAWVHGNTSLQKELARIQIRTGALDGLIALNPPDTLREEHDRLVAAIESYLVYAYFPELNPEESEDAFLELGKACGAFDRRAHELGMDSGLGLENLLSPGFCLPGLAEDFEFGSGPID